MHILYNQQKAKTMVVKSPYNFVPAPKESEVFKPDWAHQVSHDIPFSDGESGEIEIKITAETPIFIRNGHLKDAEENEFSYYLDQEGNKRYFIPGSSLKGMIRNVLEILTRSRMKQMDDVRHSVRQIMKTKGTVVDEGYELSGDEKKNIYAGYLVKKGDQYFVYSCGKPLKIRYTDIDQHFKLTGDKTFEKQFGKTAKSGMHSDFSKKTGAYKYSLLSGKKLEAKFENHPLDQNKQKSWVSKFQPLKYARFANDSTEQSFWGRIVCTGQASNYSVPTARKGEYVFKGKRSEVINNKKEEYQVSKEVIETFLFVNRHNKGENEELKDWAFWKSRLREGIPVFFRKAKGKNEVKDLGLTFMYKQPVGYSTKEVLQYPDPDKANYKPDFAEVIFGYTSKKGSLKSRVFFGHAKAEGNIQALKEKAILLSSPRSSYFPFYLKQKGNNGKTQKFNTYNNNPTLRGFKRYPVHANTKLHENNLKEEMTSRFRPLPQKTTFTGKIRFHNLRKVEIGALLSALTFHHSKNVFHSLGMAKPFGYGRVSISIESIKNLSYSSEEYLKEFELLMKTECNEWNSLEFSKELLAMAKLQNVENRLSFMDLEDFQKVKNQGYYLEDYSAISGFNSTFNWIATNNEVEKWAQKRALEKEEEEKQKNERQRRIEKQKEKKEKDKMEKNAQKAYEEVDKTSIKELENFIQYYPECTLVGDAKKNIESLKKQKKEDKIRKDQQSLPPTDITSFEDIKTWASSKLKTKGFTFTEKQKEDIVKALKKCFDNESSNPQRKKNKFYKKGKLQPYNKFPWTDIKKWLGEEKSKELYQGFEKIAHS